MFAVIKTGGKQYKVAAGGVLVVEKLAGEPGDVIAFDNVLMLGDGSDITIGAPVVSGAQVRGEVLEQRQGEKVKVFKKTRRSTYRRKNGHRQLETVVRVTEILASGATASAAAAEKPKRAPRAKKTEGA
jgi:large subunit ribosomal protein L21